MSLFANVPESPPDAILDVTRRYKACDPSNKPINLGVGAYRDEAGKPWVLPTVKAAEQKLLEMQDKGEIDKEYLTIDGIGPFYKAAVKLMLGKEFVDANTDRLCTVQCLSGTGGLRLAASTIAAFMPGAAVYIPNPTWGNHKKIFPRDGVSVYEYTYYNPATCGLDFEGMTKDMKAMPEGSVILLHACAHNPTGVDPTEEQWKEICKICKERKIFPMMDSAYQGFASGDFDKDAFACRLFAKEDVEMFLIQSFAKNMGLYGERTGAFSVLCKDKNSAKALLSQVKIFVRTMYSSPPKHGAQIAQLILCDDKPGGQLEAWKAEVKIMAERIIEMRKVLYDALKQNGCKGNWDHVIKQIGMFTYTGMKPDHVAFMEKKFIFMTGDGRISMAGLNKEKCKIVADAMKEAHEAFP